MRIVLILALAVVMIGCGVRGRPLPPNDPPYIGEGQPSAENPAQDPNMPPPIEDDEDDDDEDEN